MNRLASMWTTLRNRPLFFMGALVGLAVFVFLFVNNVNINNRVTRVEAHDPCLNLTARECALKLFSYLTPQERAGVRERVHAIQQQLRRLERRRQLLRHSARRGGAGGSPGRSPVNPPPGSQRPGSSPPVSTPTPQPQPPSSGGGGGSGGGTGSGSPSPQPQPQPIVRVPSITTPQVGPVPPITTPPIIVPCIPAPPLITCE